MESVLLNQGCTMNRKKKIKKLRSQFHHIFFIWDTSCKKWSAPNFSRKISTRDINYTKTSVPPFSLLGKWQRSNVPCDTEPGRWGKTSTVEKLLPTTSTREMLFANKRKTPYVHSGNQITALSPRTGSPHDLNSKQIKSRFSFFFLHRCGSMWNACSKIVPVAKVLWILWKEMALTG